MEKIKGFISANKKILLIVGGAILLLIAAVLIITLLNKEKKETKPKESTTIEETTVEETTTAKSDDDDDEDNMEGKKYSLLTGTPVNEKIAGRRPVAVMYNNIIDAIPHSGLYNASVVYEAPVEGSLTRLMGIFENYDKLTKIGSVRSSRLYYAQWAVEYDAIYCHYGQSDYALPFLNSGNINKLSGLESVGSTVYYRSSDRVAPHNAFASADGIKAGIAAMNYRTNYNKEFQGHFKFAEYKKRVKLKNTFAADIIRTGYRINQSWFEYNKDSKTYDRFQYGSKHIDDQNNKQLTFKNLIIQYCGFSYYPDGKSLNMGNVGQGSGQYITEGKGINITWKKDSETAITHYYNDKGQEIRLNSGKTMICIIPDGSKGNVSIN